MTKNALIIFLKIPESGKVKTRLGKEIGYNQAVEVYKKLVDYTISEAEIVSADLFLFYSPNLPTDINQKHSYRLQKGDGLGKRMQNAFSEVFSLGYKKVIIIGSDCPELNASILETAFKTLEAAEVCIGPATDGGYYLLGMKKLETLLFENKTWSTNTVYDRTINDFRYLNLNYAVLPKLSDLDTVEDLSRYPEYAE